MGTEVWGITMVKDEADIVEETVGRMAEQVDHVLVLDNGSTDETGEILGRLDCEVLYDPDPAYYQSRKMSSLAELARGCGARWIVPFDADEVWVSAEYGTIRDLLSRLPDSVLIADAKILDHVPTSCDIGETPVARMTYRRVAPCPLRKVACRAVPDMIIRQGNHSAKFPNVRYPNTVTDMLEIRHFPYRSADQFVSKVRNGSAAYAAATDLGLDQGAHWRGYGKILNESGEAVLVDDVFRKWFWSNNPEGDGLVFDPVKF